MRHLHRFSALAAASLGLLIALPACGQDRDEQIIGPEPVVVCCWGYAPMSVDSAALDRMAMLAPRRDWPWGKGRD